MTNVTLHDKQFELYISGADIRKRIGALGEKINVDYTGKKPLLIAVLNGSFMFAADLMRELTVQAEISFVKVASYHGSVSSGAVSELIGLTEHIEGRDIIVVEDIVDTGTTLVKVYDMLTERHPASVRVATLLLKPDAYNKSIPVDYAAMEIPNDFIVGYGLDYDGLGRNLRDIYKIKS